MSLYQYLLRVASTLVLEKSPNLWQMSLYQDFFIEQIPITHCINFSARKDTKKWAKMSLYQDL